MVLTSMSGSGGGGGGVPSVRGIVTVWVSTRLVVCHRPITVSEMPMSVRSATVVAMTSRAGRSSLLTIQVDGTQSRESHSVRLLVSRPCSIDPVTWRHYRQPQPANTRSASLTSDGTASCRHVEPDAHHVSLPMDKLKSGGLPSSSVTTST